MEEGVPIEHGMVTRAIANAQKKVEAHNFEIRKQLLEYDDVMNKQREVIYRPRRAVAAQRRRLFRNTCMGMIDEVVIDPGRAIPAARRISIRTNGITTGCKGGPAGTICGFDILRGEGTIPAQTSSKELDATRCLRKMHEQIVHAHESKRTRNRRRTDAIHRRILMLLQIVDSPLEGSSALHGSSE